MSPLPLADRTSRTRLPRLLRLALLSVMALLGVLGCQAAAPNSPGPAPGGGTVPATGIAGLVMAPPVMHKDNAGSWDNAKGPLNEQPLVGVEVHLLGARGEALDAPTATTDEQGIFRFDSVPVEAGLVSVMPKVADAYKPLLAPFRRGQASYVGVSSTMVVGALHQAIKSKADLTYAAFDPAKIAELQKQAEVKLANPSTTFSLHYLDALLLAWAKGDKGLKAALESLAPGITAPHGGSTPPPLKK